LRAGDRVRVTLCAGALALAGPRRHGRLERVDATALPDYLPTFALDDLVSLVHYE
jgi:hypothetical protein